MTMELNEYVNILTKRELYKYVNEPFERLSEQREWEIAEELIHWRDAHNVCGVSIDYEKASADMISEYLGQQYYGIVKDLTNLLSLMRREKVIKAK